MGLLYLALYVLIKSNRASSLPCDFFAAGSTPCVAAHSTVRALFAIYEGPLYQIKRASDNTTRDISVIPGSGYADSASQVLYKFL